MHVDVQYFDATHQALLGKIPNASELGKLVSDGLAFDDDLFWMHMMFTEQKDYDGFRSFRDLKAKLPGRISEFRDYWDPRGNTIVSKFPPTDMENARTERAGVSVALLLANNVFGLTEADWEKIPIGSVAALDFKHPSGGLVASNGSAFIEVEAKGTIVSDTGNTGDTKIRNHKSRIDHKKDEQRKAHNPNVLLGVITAFSQDPGQRVVARVLDPEPHVTDIDPFKFRLLSRLWYYHSVIQAVSRMQVLAALATRAVAIGAVHSYRELDGIPLIAPDGSAYSDREWSFPGKSLLEGRLVARAFPFGEDRVIVSGFEAVLMDVLSSQSFERLVTFGHEPTVLSVRDRVLMKRADLERAHVRSPRHRWFDRVHDLVEVEGRVVVNSAGRVLGLLRHVG